MKPSARRLLIFGSKFLIFILLLSTPFSFMINSYNHLVVWGTEVVLTIFSAPLKIQALEDGNWAVSWRPTHERLFRSTGGIGFLQLLYFNLPLLLSLIWATPTPNIHKLLRISLWGLALIFASHVLSVIALMTAEYMTHVNPEQVGYIWLKLFIGLSGQLFAVAIWAILTWRSWFPKPAAPESTPAPQPHRKPKEVRP